LDDNSFKTMSVGTGSTLFVNTCSLLISISLYLALSLHLKKLTDSLFVNKVNRGSPDIYVLTLLFLDKLIY